ncbi:MAG: phage portal protein [Burkholderia sp.]|nr:phage portal protein [Burkholderia sp.]
MVKLTPIERAIALVAPRWAVRRFLDRASLANLSRAYDGAGRGRATDGWRTSNASADTEIGLAADTLRARSRDLVRNNPTAANAVQVLVSSLVGTGIIPRAATGNADLDARIDDLWAAFAARADYHGLTDFYGLQSLAVREMIEAGEVLALQRFERRGRRGRVPLQIEIKEADHLDSTKLSATRRDGIQYDTTGRREGYWLYPQHPGDPTFNTAPSVLVPADRVLHMFERQRVQNRGVPWAAPVLRALRDFDDWHEAERTRKKTEACLVGVVLGADPDTASVAPMITRADGTQVESFEPGMIAYSKDAGGIEFNQPTAVGGVYEWSRVQWHIIAQGFRIPYALLTTDLSQTNFSSSRVGLNEFRRMIEAIQWQIIIPMFCQPVWNWFIDMLRVNGDLPVNGPDIAVEWATPAFESVNPLQDAQADRLEVRSGFATTAQKIARRGYDPRKQLAEQKQFNDEADRLGLIFDTDPRKVAQSGIIQTTGPDGQGSA